MIELIRLAFTDKATYGVLLYKGMPFCVTLERPWKGNKPFESCIPMGKYICRRYTSTKFGKTFQIMDVPGRTYILFHKGNFADDTEGCVLLGEGYEGDGISQSGKAFDEFTSKLVDVDEFQLNIRGL